MSANCDARQYGDQKQCSRCGLAWDVKDPEPPQCKPRANNGRETLHRLRADLMLDSYVKYQGRRRKVTGYMERGGEVSLHLDGRETVPIDLVKI